MQKKNSLNKQKIAQALGLDLGLQMKKKNLIIIFGLRSFTIMKIRLLQPNSRLSMW